MFLLLVLFNILRPSDDIPTVMAWGLLFFAGFQKSVADQERNVFTASHIAILV